MKKISALCLFLMLPYMAICQQVWQPVSSDVSFKIKNFGFNVFGKFSELRAKLAFDPADLDHSSLSATVDANTIKTGIRKRDKHLKEEKFFDAEQYKRIEVTGTKFYQKNAHFAGMFDVTIKGITKQIEIPFEFNQLGNEATFKGVLYLNRRDFKIGSKSLIMADYVTVTIEVKAKKPIAD